MSLVQNQYHWFPTKPTYYGGELLHWLCVISIFVGRLHLLIYNQQQKYKHSTLFYVIIHILLVNKTE